MRRWKKIIGPGNYSPKDIYLKISSIRFISYPQLPASMELRNLKARTLVCLLGLGLTACSASDTSLNNLRIQSDLDNDGNPEKIMGVYIFNTPKFDYGIYASTDKIDTSIDRPIELFRYSSPKEGLDLEAISLTDLNNDSYPDLLLEKTDGSAFYAQNLGNLRFGDNLIRLN
jgi:hypothetical protein